MQFTREAKDYYKTAIFYDDVYDATATRGQFDTLQKAMQFFTDFKANYKKRPSLYPCSDKKRERKLFTARVYLVPASKRKQPRLLAVLL